MNYFKNKYYLKVLWIDVLYLGKQPRRTSRRNSDSALTGVSIEDEVTLLKLNELQYKFKVQQERIEILEREMEMLPKVLLGTERTSKGKKGQIESVRFCLSDNSEMLLLFFLLSMRPLSSPSTTSIILRVGGIKSTARYLRSALDFCCVGYMMKAK